MLIPLSSAAITPRLSTRSRSVLLLSGSGPLLRPCYPDGTGQIVLKSLPPAPRPPSSLPASIPPALPCPSHPLAFHTDCFAAVNGSRGERGSVSKRETQTRSVCVCLRVCELHSASKRANERERERERTRKNKESGEGSGTFYFLSFFFLEGNTKVDKSSLRGSRIRTSDCCELKDGPSLLGTFSGNQRQQKPTPRRNITV